MDAPIERLQRLGLKLFLEDGAGLRPRDFVPVFHRWIQTHAVEGLLVDVADYEHVHEGPGVVLVGYEGNYSVDCGEGRMGLRYDRKVSLEGSLSERLVSLGRLVVGAARLLETDEALAGRVRFRGDEIEIVARDRLLAPNDEGTRAAFQPALDDLLRRLYGGASHEVVRTPEPSDPFTLSVRAAETLDLAALLERLGA